MGDLLLPFSSLTAKIKTRKFMSDSCPICHHDDFQSMQLDDTLVLFCNHCPHAFSRNIEKLREEIYSMEEYLAEHKNWFSNPNINFLKGLEHVY